MNGAFITFEGTEGGGKTTQVRLLAKRLEAEGYVCRILREPGGTAVGEKLRQIVKQRAKDEPLCAEAELLMMNASRAQLVREVIRPALQAGEIVICDRFYDSTIAYQGYGRGLDLGLIHNVIDFAVGETRPELTILLSVSIAVSESRRTHREAGGGEAADRFEEAGREFFRQVEAGYLQVAAANPSRVKVIDASPPVEEVALAVWHHAQALLRRKLKPAH